MKMGAIIIMLVRLRDRVTVERDCTFSEQEL